MKKKNWPLIVGLCIPIVLILLVVLSIYLPRFFVHPKVNFLFSVGQNGYYYANNSEYSVENGTLVKSDIILPEPDRKNVVFREHDIYLYNVTTEVATKISFEEAKQLHLSPNNVSSDGFSVTDWDYNRGGLFSGLFGGRDYGVPYIRGHNTSQRINLDGIIMEYYYGNFHFLGWIE